MSSYVPLDYVTDTINYFRDNRNNIFHDCQFIYNTISSDTDLIECVYAQNVSEDLGEKVSLTPLFNDVRKFLVKHTDPGVAAFATDDALNYYVMACDVTSTWRKNKVTYKVDAELCKQFYSMSLPDEIKTYVYSNQPAPCYYIDLAGEGDTIMPGLHGIFVRTLKIIGLTFIQFILVPAVDTGEVICKAMYVDTDVDAVKNLASECTNDEKLNGSALYTFFLNFCTYLNATNRDIEISERTRQNHTRTITTIKDKFREVREFDVGLRYGNVIRATRKKYVKGESTEKENAEKRSVSSHYRRAHWHHFWTGSGNDKKLIIKWVDGLFVHGTKESSSVVIHKVK